MRHDYLDRHSSLNSILHRLDPRTKIVTFFLVIIVIVSEPRGVLIRFPAYIIFVLGMAVLSRLPAKYIIHRCLIASPFILFAALLLPLSHHFGGDPRLYTDSYMLFFSLSLVLKGFLAIVCLTLMTSTGKFQRLLNALRSLKMPGFLTVMSALMYRYVFIIDDERLRTGMARQSRTPGKLRINPLRVYGNQAAVIFLRSWKRAHTVYNAMLSRGFQGEFPEYEGLKLHFRDAVFAFGVSAAFILVRIGIS